MKSAVFGYGSLILPYSLVRRFTDKVSRDEIYSQTRTKERENVLLDEENRVWKNQYEDRIEFTPVFIKGFIRAYTLESIDGGTKVQAYRTGQEEDILNGVIITGLTQDEKDQISATEKNYRGHSIQDDNVYYYNDPPEKIDISSITVYLPNSERSNWNTNILRNKTYHSRIIRGIEYLKKKYGRDVYQSFIKDFADNTYERPSETYNG